MVTKMNPDQLERVLTIWLATNQTAHDFIDPTYWKQQLPTVREAMKTAEIYVYQQQGEIVGFIGLVDGDIAGLFVSSSVQRQGIGHTLLAKAKTIAPSLSLAVYAKNQQAFRFYSKEGFVVIGKSQDAATGEYEYQMKWTNH
ncbi:GNAT family N-acetyltransferase [Enterococcus sp. AZ102]|uniref:GNAT family N-acetyltransferase n=1 Tax=Enterococcus sp. AZ102 TaxID=2774865 RepID=UPI003F255AA6